MHQLNCCKLILIEVIFVETRQRYYSCYVSTQFFSHINFHLSKFYSDKHPALALHFHVAEKTKSNLI